MRSDDRGYSDSPPGSCPARASVIHSVSSSQLVLLVVVLLLAGAGAGWVLAKPGAWRDGYRRATEDLQHAPAKRQGPPSLREIAPRWHKA